MLGGGNGRCNCDCSSCWHKFDGLANRSGSGVKKIGKVVVDCGWPELSPCFGGKGKSMQDACCSTEVRELAD